MAVVWAIAFSRNYGSFAFSVLSVESQGIVGAVWGAYGALPRMLTNRLRTHSWVSARWASRAGKSGTSAARASRLRRLPPADLGSNGAARHRRRIWPRS